MKNQKMKLLILMSLILVCILSSVSLAFERITDVDETEYEVPAYALKELDILSVYSDGTFGLKSKITRAEMIRSIIKMYGISAEAFSSQNLSTGFSDIDKENHWSVPYVYFALDYDFLDMTSDKKFNPDEEITYSEAITYCMRILGYRYLIESKGEWPQNYIEKARDERIIKGIDISSYDDKITKGDLAILLWNTINSEMWEHSNGVSQKTEKSLMEIKLAKKVSSVNKLLEELKNKPEETGKITNISFDKRSAKVCLGCNGVDTKIECSVLIGLVTEPEETSDDITWTSNNVNVLTIKNNSMVIAKQKGKVTLTAKTSDGLTATCEVEVVDHQLMNEPKYKYDDTYHWKNGVCAFCLGDIKEFEKEKHTFVNGKCVCGMEQVQEAADKTQKYDDVKKDDWYEKSVDYVTENKLMNGMGENKFNPNSSMTRAMLVTVLYRMSKSSYKGNSTFSDVTKEEYYSSAVAWAADNEIVNGVGENKFAPNAEVTREQLIVILYRYAKYTKTEIKIDSKSEISSFEDFNDVSDYSITAFEWGYEQKIISGRSATTLNPKGTASRAEVATMLMRFTEKN